MKYYTNANGLYTGLATNSYDEVIVHEVQRIKPFTRVFIKKEGLREYIRVDNPNSKFSSLNKFIEISEIEAKVIMEINGLINNTERKEK